jgi:hypothetical protein
VSPFELVIDGLASRIGALNLLAQVALLACAAEVLMPRYLDWCTTSEIALQDELLRRAIENAKAFATGGSGTPSKSLLKTLEAATPSEPSDRPWFTAAQDCWICADSAIRVAVKEMDAPDASWYLLESMFQEVSESLFGMSDVGSQDQEDGEAAALAHPRLADAIAALARTIDVLEKDPVDPEMLERILILLTPIRP